MIIIRNMHDLLELTTAEQFALWSLRHRRARPWDGRIVAEGFFRAFGLCGVEEALAAFAALCETVGRHGRRRLSLNGCACRSVAADERALLTLLAAAQAEEAAHVRALAAWLCRPEGQPALAEAARRFAVALAARDLWLPLRLEPERPRRKTRGRIAG
jgi:hypothetical protein